jgi:hypothetical protein
LACAFEELVKSIYGHEREIPVVNFGADVDIFDSLLPKNFTDTNLTFEVTKLKKIKGNEIILQLNKSAITIFDSIKTLSKYNKKVKFIIEEGPKEFQFYVYIPKAKINEIAASIDELHIYTMYNRTEIINSQNFLVNEGKFIKLYTFEWFANKKKCGRKKITEINRFDKKARKWMNSRFKVEKFLDFHGCTLTFTYYDTPGEIGLLKNGEAVGFLADIFKDLEKVFNFKMKIIISRNKFLRFLPFQMYINNLCWPPLRFGGKTIPNGHLSHPFFSTTELMIVSPGEEYSGYEKLTFPFDYHTWILIIITFVAAFLVIFIISFASVKIRKIICGENVETPSLNVTAHFFGLGQNFLPRRSFARFLVMSFIIYSLIIRTCYQGKSFEFMQKEMRKPQVQSIEEAADKNFEFYLWFCTKTDNCSTIKDRAVTCSKDCGIDIR